MKCKQGCNRASLLLLTQGMMVKKSIDLNWRQIIILYNSRYFIIETWACSFWQHCAKNNAQKILVVTLHHFGIIPVSFVQTSTKNSSRFFPAQFVQSFCLYKTKGKMWVSLLTLSAWLTDHLFSVWKLSSAIRWNTLNKLFPGIQLFYFPVNGVKLRAHVLIRYQLLSCYMKLAILSG